MKTTLRLAALIVFVGAIGYWAAAGANRGWTKNSIPQKIEDPVTGIEGVTYQKRFVPGVDFLALSAIAGLVLAGASFLFRTKSSQTNQTNKNELK